MVSSITMRVGYIHGLDRSELRKRFGPDDLNIDQSRIRLTSPLLDPGFDAFALMT